MYEIQAMAEVEIGSALHVPEVPPAVKHCDSPFHYTMKSCVLIIIRHVILYGQNMTRLIVLAPVFYSATPEHKLPVCC